MSKPISKKSKEIIKLIENGQLQCEIKKLGYSYSTVRYYWKKVLFPDKFYIFVARVQGYNKKREALKKQSDGKRHN
jgi:hypothetical protein